MRHWRFETISAADDDGGGDGVASAIRLSHFEMFVPFEELIL